MSTCAASSPGTAPTRAGSGSCTRLGPTRPRPSCSPPPGPGRSGPDRLDQPHGGRDQRPGHRGRPAPPGLPWRPADVAQREGRILRQRKQAPPGATSTGTSPSAASTPTCGRTVTRKAKFIDQVHPRQTTSRDAEDIGGDMAALSYSEVTALATGDMRILAKAKADSDVRRLQDLESAWARTRQHLKTKISDNTRSAARLHRRDRPAGSRGHESTAPLPMHRLRAVGTRAERHRLPPGSSHTRRQGEPIRHRSV